ncbi:MAG: hypothetical protein K2M95_07825 [Clostridiales bacterium]|nr:hypothetical protein [Clostridiales bacterium]
MQEKATGSNEKETTDNNTPDVEESNFMQNCFVPVRVMNKKWAERFVRGEMFMRSLSDFGSWNRLKNIGNDALVNNYRGDLDEGAVKTVANAEEDEIFRCFPQELKNVMRERKIIDAGDIPYFNLMCMYCLHYLPNENSFETPSERLREFVDTAVVITDMDAFLDRFLERVERKAGYAFLMDAVTYYSEDKTQRLNPLFNKTDRYAWQNELRLAVGRLATGKKLKNGKYPIVKSSEPLKLRIPSLSDIVLQISTAEFIRGAWDKSRVKLVDLTDEKSFAGAAKRKTDEAMRAYVPTAVKPAFTV